MNEKIARFFAERRPATPCLVLDLDVVKENYTALAHALPEARIYYAVKANPAPHILKLLARLGSSFDCASIQEIDMVLAAGAKPADISYGNTIKKQSDIARAYQRGVRLYAFDSIAELDKIAVAAPGSRVFCRILTATTSRRRKPTAAPSSRRCAPISATASPRPSSSPAAAWSATPG